MCYYKVATCGISIQGRAYIYWISVDQSGCRQFKMLCAVSKPFIMVKAGGLHGYGEERGMPGYV